MEMVFAVPSYLDEIVERMSSREWLIHNFNISNSDELYNPANYLHNIETENIKYIAHLDLNIFQYLVNAAKKNKANELFRDAVAYLVFFQIAGIEVDPTYAVYEKVNYDAELTGAAISDLEIFNNINNHDTEELALYALGLSDSVSVSQMSSLNREELHQQLTRYKRLTDWDSLYLVILAITLTAIDSNIAKKDKLEAFINWSIQRFRFSLPGLVYAVVLFSNNPIKGMMKFGVKQDGQERARSLQNMTWDLYYMNRFFRLWVERETGQEQLLVSGDRPFSFMLKLAVGIQKHGNLDALYPFLGESKDAVAEMALHPNSQKVERVYGSEQWGPEYRANLIKEFEAKLRVHKT